MSFTIDFKPDGAWHRNYSVRSKTGKMTARLFWSTNYRCINAFAFHKVERSERIEFIKALIDHLKHMGTEKVNAWLYKGSTARFHETLTSLGFVTTRDDQYVSASELRFAENCGRGIVQIV